MKDISLIREIEKELKIALRFSKIILICGPTKSGKTALLKRYKQSRAYYDLGKQLTFENFKASPEVFSRRLKYPCIIENIEEGKELLHLLYSDLKYRNPGDIILTTDQELSPELKRFVKTVDNQISVYELSYPTYFELNNKPCLDLDFNNLKIPYNLKTDDNLLSLASRAFDYGSEVNERKLIDKLKDNAFKLNYNALEIDLIDKVLSEIAKCAGNQVNISALAAKLDTNKYTINTILNLLIKFKVVNKLEPINDEELNYVVKTEKIYFYSINLLCKLLNIKNNEFLLLSDYRDQILENYLINMIINQYKTVGRHILFNYYENTNGVKIDLILNNIGKVNLVKFQLRTVNEKKLKQGEKVFLKTRLKIGQSIVVSYDIDRTYDNTVYSLITPDFFA